MSDERVTLQQLFKEVEEAIDEYLGDNPEYLEEGRDSDMDQFIFETVETIAPQNHWELIELCLDTPRLFTDTPDLLPPDANATPADWVERNVYERLSARAWEYYNGKEKLSWRNATACESCGRFVADTALPPKGNVCPNCQGEFSSEEDDDE